MRMTIRIKIVLAATLLGLFSTFTNIAFAQSSASPVQVSGEASVEVTDYFDTGKYEVRYFIIDRQTRGRTEVFFPGQGNGPGNGPGNGMGNNPDNEHFRTGNIIRVSGNRRPNGRDVDFESIELLEANPADGPVSSEPGETAEAPVATPVTREVLTLLVDFNDAVVYDPIDAPRGPTLQDVKDVMFNNTKNVAHFYTTASLGTLTIPAAAPGISPDEIPVYGPYQVNMNYLAANGATCSSSTYVSAALALWEADTGQSRSDYKHHSLILPNYWDYDPACGFGGQAQLFCGSSCWAVSLDPLSILHGVVVHELGHNFDMHHASTDTDNNGSVNCEYCDNSDMMGSSRNWKKFNTAHLDYKGWHDPVNYEIRTITPSSTVQSFDLIPMDEEDTEWPGLRAVETTRTASSDYYLSYRQRTGHYNNIETAYTTGANLHWRSSSGNRSLFYRMINAGEVFADPTADLIVTGVGSMTIDNIDLTDTTEVFTIEVCNTTCDDLVQPVNLTATATSGSTINLAWQDYTFNEDGFTIETSPNGSSGWTLVTIVATNSTGYVDTGLSEGTAYYYRVQAYRGVSETSPWSNTANATTLINTGPTASFTFSTNVKQVTFTDTSTDDLAVVSWLWNFGDGQTSTAQHPQHTYATFDTFTVSLTVEDGDSESDNTSQQVTVVPDITPPVITIIAPNPASVKLGTVYVDTGATALDDQEGDLTSSIIVGGMPVDTSELGAEAVTYDVADSSGNAAMETRTVNVIANQSPVADFSSSLSGFTVDFSDLSDDPDGVLEDWSWDFGDTSTSSDTSALQDPSYVYPGYGTYSVSLTVTDDNGATGNISKDVTITPPCSVTKDVTAGDWATFALPCMPNDLEVGKAFSSGATYADYDVTWVVYEYDNVNQGYIRLGKDDLLEVGKGYFFYPVDDATLEVSGGFNTIANIPLTTNTIDGVYNLVGNPHSAAVSWVNIALQNGGSNVNWSGFDKSYGPNNPTACEKTVQDTKCNMRWEMNKWTGSSYTVYNGETPNVGTLAIGAMDAVWVLAHKSGVELKFPSTASAPPAEASLALASADSTLASANQGGSNNDKGNNGIKGDKGNKGGGGSGDTWYVQLVAESGTYRDDGNWLGQSVGVKAGTDRRDLEEWYPFGGNYLSIVFTNPAFDAVGWGYTTDYRPLTATPQGEWPFVVRASSNIGEVTLKWEGDAAPFDNALLIDEISGEAITIIAGESYTFVMNGDEHPFRIIFN